MLVDSITRQVHLDVCLNTEGFTILSDSTINATCKAII